MDSLRSALSIVPSGTAATIIVGHALLTKVMICVETSQCWVILRIIAETSPSSCRSYGDDVASMAWNLHTLARTDTTLSFRRGRARRRDPDLGAAAHGRVGRPVEEEIALLSARWFQR